MNTITVVKRDHMGNPVWEYEGEILAQGNTWVCLQAQFNRDDFDAGYMVYRRGDLFTEWFYSDRWYNVFRIEDVDNGALKGWYCNIVRPAEIGEGYVVADDLALDVFVSPDSKILVLDEQEFMALNLSEDEQHEVVSAVDMIRQLVMANEAPFVHSLSG